MTGDNGKGLRALFYGLCSFWGIDVWDEERMGESPADFYLPYRMGAYVIIVPGPADRQVEIGALLQRQEKFVVLDEYDLDRFRSCQNRVQAANYLCIALAGGDTHAARERQRLGISS